MKKYFYLALIIVAAIIGIGAASLPPLTNARGGGTNVLSSAYTLKTLTPGANITISDSPTNLTISTGGGVGEANTASNVGLGTNIFYQKSGVDLQFKTLLPGANITLTDTPTNITIASSGSGDPSITNGFVTLATAAPLTNGFLVLSTAAPLTNGFLTLATAAPLTNGFEKATVTNGLASISWVAPLTNGFLNLSTAAPLTNGYLNLATAAPLTNGYLNLTTAAPLTNGFEKATLTNGLASVAWTAPLTNGFLNLTTAAPLTNGYLNLTTAAPLTNNFLVLSTAAPLTNGYVNLATAAPLTNGYVNLATAAPLTNGYVNLATAAPLTNGYALATLAVLTNGNQTVDGVKSFISPTTNTTIYMTRSFYPSVTSIYSDTAITNDASFSKHYVIIVTNNFTLGCPTNAVDGDMVIWRIGQDATGSRTVTLAAGFITNGLSPAISWSTTGTKRDYLGAVYYAASNVWDVISFKGGFN